MKDKKHKSKKKDEPNLPFSAHEQGKKLKKNKQRKQRRLDDIMNNIKGP